jgi:hypothetical protein
VLVYGDRTSVRDVRSTLADIESGLGRIARAGPGERRHSAAVALLLAAGELAQALADRSHAERGGDGPDPDADAAMTVVLSLAQIVWRSHRSGWRTLGPIAGAQAALAALAALRLPARAAARSAEGFEHYALYPEAYAEAATALAPAAAPLIIGIRTIGSTLAAMVAVGCGARDRPITVRPVGHPFERTLALRPQARAALRRHRRRTFAVVDEGPGLSGSSFAAVLRALRDAGVPPANVHVFPSHAGPAPLASASTRALWDAAPRHCRSFEAMFLGADPRGLGRWTEALTGPQATPPEDLAGGRWRALHFHEGAAWPPAHLAQERRKYLLRTQAGTFLAKFAGLGPAGDRRLARARRLGDEGLCPRALGLRNGFLVEAWHGDARPLAGAAIARGRVVGEVGRYVAYRATMRDAPGPGASPRDLLSMATANATEELGPRGRALEIFADWLDELARVARPVEVDARMHAWEWLVSNGRLIKTDAVDHCEGHDLVGPQDIAWDVAGAAIELDLAPHETEAVRRAAERAGARVPREALAFHHACYLSFQLGYYRMAARAHAADARERARLDAAAARYAAQLERTLAGDPRRAGQIAS